jgi:hypothetical protein
VAFYKPLKSFIDCHLFLSMRWTLEDSIDREQNCRDGERIPHQNSLRVRRSERRSEIKLRNHLKTEAGFSQIPLVFMWMKRDLHGSIVT